MTHDYLLMPIWATMQSWGDLMIAGDDKPSLPFPTHSGLCGLICAGLGIRREQKEELCQIHQSLNFIILEVCQGTQETDFYAVNGLVRAEKLTSKPNDTFIGRKTFLSDTAFLVAVYEEKKLDDYSLEEIGKALLNPIFPIYAGRKSYPFLTPPVFHEQGNVQVKNWEHPFDEMKQLLVEEANKQQEKQEHLGIFKKKLPPVSKKAIFYYDHSLSDMVQKFVAGDSGEQGAVYSIYDRFLPSELKTRQFERRNVHSINIQGGS
ncbi:MAG: CRISPR system Cascade subunit CasD [bacterium]|jgi:CRISPR system Cascade subunit CasD